MADLFISEPIQLEMKFLEYEEHLPSFKLYIKAEIKHPTGYFIYQADDIWFGCSSWDSFLLSIKMISYNNKTEASLIDLSEYLTLNVKSDSGNLYFSFQSKEPDVGNGVTSINYNSIINHDVFNQIINRFNDFPKWW